MSMASFIPDPECELERSELLIGINARSPKKRWMKSETTKAWGGRPSCHLHVHLSPTLDIYIYIFQEVLNLGLGPYISLFSRRIPVCLHGREMLSFHIREQVD